MNRQPSLLPPAPWQLSLLLVVAVVSAGLALAWAIADAARSALEPMLSAPTWLLFVVLMALDQGLDSRCHGYRHHKHYGFGVLSAAALYFHLDWPLWLSVATPAALSLSVSYAAGKVMDRPDFVDART